MPDEDNPQQLEELHRRGEALQKKLELVTNKEVRAEIQYELAKIQWQLGLISDDELHRIEEFYENFTYEWC